MYRLLFAALATGITAETPSYDATRGSSTHSSTAADPVATACNPDAARATTAISTDGLA